MRFHTFIVTHRLQATDREPVVKETYHDLDDARDRYLELIATTTTGGRVAISAKDGKWYQVLASAELGMLNAPWLPAQVERDSRARADGPGERAPFGSDASGFTRV